ncbi:MAG: hypothetical protein WDZ52_11985 [Pseudohongiellaceae bacterium]
MSGNVKEDNEMTDVALAAENDALRALVDSALLNLQRVIEDTERISRRIKERLAMITTTRD